MRKTVVRKFIPAVLVIFAASRGVTQEHQHRNGETLGSVHFATSCNEAAQNEFDHAVALLQIQARLLNADELEKEPRRFRSLYGAAHAAQLSGNHDSSQKYFRELLKNCARAERPARSELEEAERAILQK